MIIKAVLFNLDGTLLDRDSSLLEFVRASIRPLPGVSDR